jgi:hypothetical protein
MKFLKGLIFALLLTAFLVYTGLAILDRHIKQVVVADLQEITAPPR